MIIDTDLEINLPLHEQQYFSPADHYSPADHHSPTDHPSPVDRPQSHQIGIQDMYIPGKKGFTSLSHPSVTHRHQQNPSPSQLNAPTDVLTPTGLAGTLRLHPTDYTYMDTHQCCATTVIQTSPTDLPASDTISSPTGTWPGHPAGSVSVTTSQQ